MVIQFKKGVLELCLLAMLRQDERYGYDIANSLSGMINISDGSVYPVLRRLKSDGYVSSYLKESSGGPPRKYYSITDSGITFLNELEQEWQDLSKQVNDLLMREENKQ